MSFRLKRRFHTAIYLIATLILCFFAWQARGVWDRASHDAREADRIETILAKGGK